MDAPGHLQYVRVKFLGRTNYQDLVRGILELSKYIGGKNLMLKRTTGAENAHNCSARDEDDFRFESVESVWNYRNASIVSGKMHNKGQTCMGLELITRRERDIREMLESILSEMYGGSAERIKTECMQSEIKKY